MASHMGDGAKEEFLRDFGEHYGYPNGPKSIDQIRANEFKRLQFQDLVYLDHAGATLYSDLQMESVFSDLTNNVYGNPHSQSDSSSATLDIVKNARLQWTMLGHPNRCVQLVVVHQEVLDYCNASPKEYTCIFTSGATAALKLYRYALGHGAQAIAVDIDEDIHPGMTGETLSSKMSPHQVQRRNVAESPEGEPTGNSLGHGYVAGLKMTYYICFFNAGDVYNLFAFPSECNFSGLRFGLDLVNIIKEDSSKILGISSVCK
ncbi:hypothetical protein V8G54_024297 [Vigna mungo]|uniref:Molybdenum cofactor sulfurase n=1 Tax=Vigna mungo TaxID=3915 RepID=A0AAQ3N6I3_VIGMU